MSDAAERAVSDATELSVLVRPERPEDAAAIRELERQAFGREEEAGLVDALRDAGAFVLSAVAVLGATDEIVAHALFTRVTVTPADGTMTDRTAPGGAEAHVVSLLGLGPVAVLPALQGRGIGTRLVEACLERLRVEGHPAVVVVGHPGYYPRFGFLPAGRWGLRWETDIPEEAVMAMELTPGALRDVGGVVRFRPEFEGV